MRTKPTIIDINLIDNEDPEQRRIETTLSNGTVVKAESCYESWQQWGGTETELYITMPVAEALLFWLQGDDTDMYGRAPEDVAEEFID